MGKFAGLKRSMFGSFKGNNDINQYLGGGIGRRMMSLGCGLVKSVVVWQAVRFRIISDCKHM